MILGSQLYARCLKPINVTISMQSGWLHKIYYSLKKLGMLAKTFSLAHELFSHFLALKHSFFLRDGLKLHNAKIKM